MPDKIVKVKDSETGKITNLTQSDSGTLTKAGNVVKLSKTQKIIQSDQKKNPMKMKGKDGYTMMDKGPNMAHHPMKMKHSAYNMKPPYNMKPQILKHMSGK